MIRVAVWLVSLAPLVFCSCASQLRLQALPATGQSIQYLQGLEACVSPGTIGVAVWADPQVYQSSERPTFFILAQNNSDKSIDFSTENISVSIEGQPLKVYTFDELVAEVESQRKWGTFAAALAGASQSFNAGSAVIHRVPTLDTHTIQPLLHRPKLLHRHKLRRIYQASIRLRMRRLTASTISCGSKP
jgi:hypothetical protein